MLRVTKSGRQWFAIELTEDDEQDMNDIRNFVNDGSPTILTNDLEDLRDFDIDPDEVTVVERD